MEFERPGRLADGLGSFSNIIQNIPVGPETKEQIYERLYRNRDMSKITVTPAIPDVNPFDPRFRKRVAIYCRVSTDNLAQTPSFITQQKYYLKYVRERPELRMVAMYKDEGLTATSIQNRGGLVRLLRDAEMGKFDMIIVKNLSRLSRNLMDCMRIIFKLRMLPKPIGILFETEKLYTLNRENDFTLQILALIAQEESHKKSEAVTYAQRQRYEQGNFMVFDILGFDRVGVNKIAINPDEAWTVRLIFMMYLAGYDPTEIADTLCSLGRKKHTHHYVDGRVREGDTNWNRNSVINVLKNEKQCGNIDAQKTVTPSYLDHKAVKNVGQAPRYHAEDQHNQIIEPPDFYTVQKMLASNRGGWKYGLQNLEIYNNGIFSGGVLTIPNWYGFNSEDYNRACLRAHGIDETTLEEIEGRIRNENNNTRMTPQPVPEEIPSMIEVDSDDYENFPEEKMSENDTSEIEKPKESFFSWVAHLREREAAKKKVNKLRWGKTDLTNIEYCRGEFFSLREKIMLTMDHRGIQFNKFAFIRLSEGAGEPVLQIELIYFPLEKMLIFRKADKESPSTIGWVKENNGKFFMKRCGTKGVSDSIYTNMSWNTEYKYRIIGRAVEHGRETFLVFFLDQPIKNVPINKNVIENSIKEKPNRKKKRSFVDGYLPEDIILPDLDDISLVETALPRQIKDNPKSDAIYYDEQTNKDETSLTLEDLGPDRYSPERIRHLMQRGLSPAEGWSYLQGMASIHKNSFSIFQEDWADNFGSNIYDGRDAQLQLYLDSRDNIDSDPVPYGWTVGLHLPTKETVKESIANLRNSKQ